MRSVAATRNAIGVTRSAIVHRLNRHSFQYRKWSTSQPDALVADFTPRSARQVRSELGQQRLAGAVEAVQRPAEPIERVQRRHELFLRDVAGLGSFRQFVGVN